MPTNEEIMAKLAEAVSQQTEVLKSLSQQSLHTKAPATTNTATPMHGPTGIFSSPVEREIISAHLRSMGLAAALPVKPTVYTNPLFGTITGFSDVSGAEAVNPCDDAPSAYIKGCNLTAQFGRLMRDTQTIEIDKVIQKKNRGDFSDLILIGELMNSGGFNPTAMSQQDFLDVVVKSEMITVGVGIERALTRQLWQGNPANNTAGGGYKEFPGLDLQIATGQKDAETGVLCPSLDSDIKDFAYDLVGGTGRDIVEYLSMLEYYLRNNATRMGLDPVQWAVVMPQGLWFELSAAWPCSYLSNRCKNSAGTNIGVINDNVNVSMRDAMRNNNYIEINGNRYPVIVDDGIYVHDSTNTAGLAMGEFASSIYMVPLTIVGGFNATYLEYSDYTKIAPNVNLLRGMETFWSDNGRYMWAYDSTKFCFKLSAKTEQRVVLRTPQLAGKIQHVKYSPLQSLRSSDPTSPYWVNGGVSLRSAPSYNTLW